VAVRSVSSMDTDPRDLAPAQVLAASADAARDRRLAEVRDLETLSWWAAIHSTDPTQGPDGKHQRRVGNVLRAVGGEGTPWVQDLCLGEIAMARGTGVTAATNAMADVLDLQHRLPLTWQVCRTGGCEVGVARRVAKLSRHLPVDKVWVVDQAVSRMIAHEAGGRTLAVAEAKVIEADPQAHAARVEAEKQRRFVGLSRVDQYGLRMVIARLEAGDAAVLWALLELVADILAPRRPDLSRDELRAAAFGYVIRPAELLQLILEHAIATQAQVEQEQLPGPKPEEPVLHSAIAFPADLLEALKSCDWSAWAPKATLYVHLHQAALTDPAGVRSNAVARVEGLGPLGLEQLQSLLGRAVLSVKPVLDLSDRVRTTAYEHPESLKERIHLITGGDYWPYATSTSRHVDHDHPTPFDHAAARAPDPPEQTGTHNSGPLGRTHHRWKTHGRYRARQSGQGRDVLTTPHGLAFLRDHHGTRRIPLDKARMIIDAPDGVDLYLPDVTVEIDL
jgi:hypothetical protein